MSKIGTYEVGVLYTLSTRTDLREEQNTYCLVKTCLVTNKRHNTNSITVLSKRADKQLIWPSTSTLTTRIKNRNISEFEI